MSDTATILRCVKCGGESNGPHYHKDGCSREVCSCVSCGYFDNVKEHTEHLHYYCRCGFDWIGPVAS